MSYKTHWKRRDGSLIEYSDMTTSHIENSINMLERKNEDFLYVSQIKRLKIELEKREQIEILKKLEKKDKKNT